MTSYLSLLPFLIAVAVAAVTGMRFQPGVWYDSLAKPSWTPPGWVFGPVWSIMYTAIAVAGWLAWSADGYGAAFWIWTGGLVLNMAWSWIMFGLKRIGAALADLVAMWLSVAAFIAVAWPVSRDAALLFIPYLAWVSFAGALNYTIWRMNR